MSAHPAVGRPLPFTRHHLPIYLSPDNISLDYDSGGGGGSDDDDDTPSGGGGSNGGGGSGGEDSNPL